MKTHWSFWLIGIFALLWNAGGTMNLFMQMNPEALSQMPESHQAIANTRPLWGTAAFAVSVIGGLIGAILLLLKKPFASTLFMLSAIGALVVTVQTLISNNVFAAPIGLSAGEFVMVIIGSTAAALLFWFYSKAKFAA